MSKKENSQRYRAAIDYKNNLYEGISNCWFQAAEQLHRVIKNISMEVSNEIVSLKIMKCLPPGQCSKKPDDRILGTDLIARPFDIGTQKIESCLRCQDSLHFVDLSGEKISDIKYFTVKDIEQILSTLNPDSLPFYQRVLEKFQHVVPLI